MPKFTKVNKLFTISALAISLTLSSCSEHDKAKTQITLAPGHYGLKNIDETNAISSEELFAKVLQKDSLNLKVEGEITQVCQSSGCWVMVKKDDSTEFLVKFKDDFSIPKESKGKKIIFEGLATKKVKSIDDLKEEAKEDGKSEAEINAISQEKHTIRVVADAVIIK